MKLKRESIKDSEVKGKWYFVIEGKAEEAEKIEQLENALKAEGWEEECDGCPLYEEGQSSGFWIHHSDVEQFKADWKNIK